MAKDPLKPSATLNSTFLALILGLLLAAVYVGLFEGGHARVSCFGGETLQGQPATDCEQALRAWQDEHAMRVITHLAPSRLGTDLSKAPRIHAYVVGYREVGWAVLPVMAAPLLLMLMLRRPSRHAAYEQAMEKAKQGTDS